ncbi:MAG: formimidoylglutamase [Desulfuromusa sp.]|nr:formimidoylglutamase [Desulfuromusa sp.]
MYKQIDMSLWAGRDDGHGKERWHQNIVPLKESAPAGIALLGVASDEGVKRNHGRIGAAAGPDAIRTYLANLAYHQSLPLYDAGNLYCKQGDLEALQYEQADKVCQLLEQKHFPLIIGGGHEIAYGSFSGLEKYLSKNQKNDPIGVINLDAHFDLRRADQATSGTPFLQMANHCHQQNISFNYLCLGISDIANTGTLFTTARQLNVKYLRDEDLNSWQLEKTNQQLKEFIQPCHAIYLSIDLDVLPAATAPGVSAPAAQGVPQEILEWLLTSIKQISGKRLKLADIAEYNPEYDIDGRTARVAARLCHLLIRKEEL